MSNVLDFIHNAESVHSLSARALPSICQRLLHALDANDAGRVQTCFHGSRHQDPLLKVCEMKIVIGCPTTEGFGKVVAAILSLRLVRRRTQSMPCTTGY